MRTPYSELTEEQKERKRESVRRYQAANKTKVLAKRREYDQSDAGKASKKACEERYKASGKRKLVEERRAKEPVSFARKQARVRWAKSEKGKTYACQQRALRRSCDKNIDDFSKFVLIEAAHLAKVRQKLTGFEWHIDHIIPVSLGGTSRYSNIQVVPASWNRIKSNKHSEKFFGA